jgi:hypothetical protein
LLRDSIAHAARAAVSLQDAALSLGSHVSLTANAGVNWDEVALRMLACERVCWFIIQFAFSSHICIVLVLAGRFVHSRIL